MSRKTPPSQTAFECVGGGPADGAFIDIVNADPRRPFVYTQPGTGTRAIYALVRMNGGRPLLAFLGHEAPLGSSR